MESEEDVVSSYMHDSGEGAIALGDVVGKELSKLRSHISESQVEDDDTAEAAEDGAEAEPKDVGENAGEPEDGAETEEAEPKED
jgi:hypothetical protein